jgi:transposase
MTIVAEEYRHVMGVDTHARTHTYAIVDTSSGACTATESFPTTAAAIRRAIAWMKRNTDGNVLAAIDADRHLRRMKAQLKELVEQLAPGFLIRPGIGPVTAAVILCAYSHHGRIRSEAAFAALAGVSPLPASSGNTVRHRLNRHGDRQLNMALDVIVKVRMVHDETTRLYAARRTGEGRTYREIKRVLKRYTARAIFRELHTLLA